MLNDKCDVLVLKENFENNKTETDELKIYQQEVQNEKSNE